MVDSIFEPGALVRLTSKFDWGIGQVQSVIDERVTVNFEHKGKVVLNINQVDLSLISLDE